MEFYASNRAAWRKWLQAHAKTEKGVWLVYDKKPNRILSPDDITEEAICFGWIDSLPRTKSKTQAMLYVSPRKPKSSWSALNRTRAERMIRRHLMTEQGLVSIQQAKKSGTWLALKEVQASIIPSDLKKALQKKPLAKKYFDAFPPSSKRIILEWILNAKQDATRHRRIVETVELAEKNIRANHYRQ